jgi:hypothetical protein
MGVVDTSTSRGRNFCIRSPFGALDTSLERSIRGLQLLTVNIKSRMTHIFFGGLMPKKRRLGPQNGSGSSGPEKLPKIVNYQNCQKIVLSQLEKVGGHRYPPGSPIQDFYLESTLKKEG